MEHFISLGSNEDRLEINPDHITGYRFQGTGVTLYLLNGQSLALTAEEANRFKEVVEKTREKRKIGLSPF
jgi:hypothetical protein